jgi:hypothetical protein
MRVISRTKLHRLIPDVEMILLEFQDHLRAFVRLIEQGFRLFLRRQYEIGACAFFLHLSVLSLATNEISAAVRWRHVLRISDRTPKGETAHAAHDGPSVAIAGRPRTAERVIGGQDVLIWNFGAARLSSYDNLSGSAIVIAMAGAHAFCARHLSRALA